MGEDDGGIANTSKKLKDEAYVIYLLVIFIISLNVLLHVCFDKPLVNYYNLPTYGE